MSKSVVGTYSTSRRDDIRNKIKSFASQYFGSTLNLESDIGNIMVSQMYYESRLNYSAIGPNVGYAKGTSGYKYVTDPLILQITNGTDPVAKANVYQGLRAVGLGQVMGYNFVKGVGSGGVCEIERLRKDLAPQLVVNPGADIFAAITGESNANKAILAAMIILEGKWKAAKLFPDGWGFSTSPKRFGSRIEASVGAYLGLGSSDVNGTTANSYSTSIVRGTTYEVATGNSVQVRDYQTSSSQVASTNGSGASPVVPPGCA